MIIYYLFADGRIGEGVNTPDCGSGMQGFESLILPQNEKKPLYLKVYFFLYFFTINIYFFSITSSNNIISTDI